MSRWAFLAFDIVVAPWLSGLACKIRTNSQQPVTLLLSKLVVAVPDTVQKRP